MRESNLDQATTGIVCGNCQRVWHVAVPESVYLHLELLSRPCPYCEACTLSLCAAATGSVAAFRRTWRPRTVRHAAGPLQRGQA